MITRVPPRVLGYSHIGTCLFFDAEGKVQSDTHWWNKFLEEVKGDLNGFLTGKVAAFDDHAIKNYVRNCKKNLRRNPF